MSSIGVTPSASADFGGGAKRISSADTYLRRSTRAFFRRPANLLALSVIVLGLLMAVTPLAWLPYNPILNDIINRLRPADYHFGAGAHFFGTDALGRDILTRMVYGSRYTYLVTASAALLSSVLGSTTGLITAHYRGRIDAIISRLIDIQLSFPVVLLCIAVLAVAGPSVLNMILVLGLVDWAQYARLVRGAALSVGSREFVTAATSVGATNRRIIFYHIMPNVLSSIIVLSTFSMARLMLTESALSFLGLGVTHPATTWGAMIGNSRDYFYRAPWTSVWAGLLLTLTVMAINLVGDGLRDAFDPQNIER